jgi:Ca-activated chloride channel homolog
MSGLRISAVEMAWLLWFVPVLAALYAYASFRRKKVLEDIAGSAGQMNIPANRKRRIVKQAMTAGAVFLVAAALCRPSWNETSGVVQGSGRNVVFIVDVSRSMLARDVSPNRLERSKLAVGYMADALAGQRVALVAFAGSAVLKCPLTMDQSFFKLALKELSPDSVPLGGTSVAAAIRKACEEISAADRAIVDIVLVSDGEDLGGDPLKAAREAGDLGIRIIAAGIGGETGERIPAPDDPGGQGFLTWDGKEVLTRLDSVLLKRVAEATPGGRYIDLVKENLDFRNLFRDDQVEAGDSKPGARTVRLRDEKFQLLLALAFVLLCIEPLIGERDKK